MIQGRSRVQKDYSDFRFPGDLKGFQGCFRGFQEISRGDAGVLRRVLRDVPGCSSGTPGISGAFSDSMQQLLQILQR